METLVYIYQYIYYIYQCLTSQCKCVFSLSPWSNASTGFLMLIQISIKLPISKSLNATSITICTENIILPTYTPILLLSEIS